MDVVAINRERGTVLFDDATEVPIDTYFDDEGEETDSVNGVVAVVRYGDSWWGVDMAAFGPRTLH